MTVSTETLSRPETVGFESAQLRHIDRHLGERYVRPGKIAGALTLVARHGQIVHRSPLGQRDLERGSPMQEDTIFRIYSMTKPITSIALMQLYEQGRLQLEDPVRRFIPEWRDLGVFVSGNHPSFVVRRPRHEMAVHDLLTHMSGLTYGFMERTNVDAAYRRLGVGERQGKTLDDMAKELATLPLEFDPGSAWNYSVATDVLGLLVERISGQRFDVYLHDHLFEPLGMCDTGFHVPEAKADRLASSYTRRADKSLAVEDDAAESRYLEQPDFFSGGGGLVSTATDYYRFCQMLLNGGELEGQRIIGRKTLELMTLNHLPDRQDLSRLSVGTFSETTYDGIGFGLGFAVTEDLAKARTVGSVGEFFWGGAASTIFWVDPAESLIVVFMTQLVPSGTFNFRGQLKSIVYGAIRD